MASEVPYLLAPKRLSDLFAQIQSAAVPERFTFEFLKKLGFASSNDRALPSLLKKLGFLDPSGLPTQRYRDFRSKADAPFVLADGIRELYSELFSINEQMHKESRENIRGAIARVSEADERLVGLMANTFVALCQYADFSRRAPQPSSTSEKVEAVVQTVAPAPHPLSLSGQSHSHKLSFRYNIEIHLPATTDIAVYNAIFKSLKDHLGD